MKDLQIVIVGGWAQSAETYSLLADALKLTFSDRGTADFVSTATVKVLSLETDAAALYKQLDASAAHFRQADRSVLWLGCSLGGLHLLRWLDKRFLASSHDSGLDQSQLNEFIVLLGTNPLFCEHPEQNWPGMPLAALNNMRQELSIDQARTIRAFNILQCKGLPASRRRDALKLLNGSASHASTEILTEGLDLLKNDDLRPELVSCPLPLLALVGELDSLTGISVAKALGDLVAGASCHQQVARKVECIPGAGHYPDEITSLSVAEHSKEFLSDVSLSAQRLDAHG